MPVTENMPAKVQRNATLIQGRIAGMTYRELAKLHKVDKSTVCRILNREEIKDVVDQGMLEMISRVPKAMYVIDQALDDYKDNPQIALKASMFNLQTATIAPSKIENQTINNIVNVQNNVTLSEGVAKSIQGMFSHDDEDVMEGEIDET